MYVLFIVHFIFSVFGVFSNLFRVCMQARNTVFSPNSAWGGGLVLVGVAVLVAVIVVVVVVRQRKNHRERESYEPIMAA